MKVLDDIDKKILALLQLNGRMTVKEISNQLNLSSTPIFERIKKFEKSGIIDHYAAVLNNEQLGKKLNAFAHISLKNHSKALVQEFVNRIEEIPEIMECHYVAGGADFILKILVNDMEEYNEFLMEKLLDIPNIGKMESFLSLKVSKKTSSIML
jgi:Lrp/AsnC family transcriptional regulator, leucine-responsive regulatory protein